MSHHLNAAAVLCAVTFFLGTNALGGADSTALSRTPGDTDAAPLTDSVLATFSVDTAARPDTSDSALKSVLADLEREAAQKSLAGENTADSPSASRTSVSVGRFFRQLPGLASAHRLLFFGSLGALFLLAVALGLTVAAGSKKEALRFMTTTRLSLMNSEVQRACLHIEKNFADGALSPDSVCAAIITGRPFLEALFEKELGLGIAAYIRQARIHRAKLMVRRNPGADHSGIYRLTGFADAAAFATEFKAVTGMDFNDYTKGKQNES